jgi:titin
MNALLSRLFGRPVPRPAAARRRRARPAVEALEGRLAPAVFTVVNANDSGAGSLRQAILQANANAGADTINIKIASGPQTINLLSALPALTGPTVVNGQTQPGFTTTPIIELNGAGAGPGASGLTLMAGGSSVRGLVINRFAGSGIVLRAGGCSVLGCFLGTDVAGAAARPNGRDGVTILSGAAGNVVGGTVAHTSNLISGNGRFGVYIVGPGAAGNFVEGNFIGSALSGAAAVPNQDGVVVAGGAANNLIGGAAGNLLSGNVGAGVVIAGATTLGNKFQANFLGLTASGTAALPNAEGVLIAGGAHGNVVGGPSPALGNFISGNSGDGVHLDGAATTGNLVQGNTIGLSSGGVVLGGGVGNAVGVAFRDGARANTAAGNVISGNGTGVLVTDLGTSANQVAGNRIGTDAAGTTAQPNNLGVLVRSGAAGNTIAGNLISGNSSDGVQLANPGTTGNVIRGNLIGLNAAGTAALANGIAGVQIRDGASNNVVGGTTAAARNVISGNAGSGVRTFGAGTDGNVIQGNFIGLNAAGTAAIPNNVGVEIAGGSTHTRVGGAVAGGRNVISGNSGDGVAISDVGTTGAVVQGNFIGLNSAGSAALANGGDGVNVELGASGVIIGGTTALARNVISGNARAGVAIASTAGANCVVQGNFIGTNAAGTGPVGNTQHGVVIFGGAHDNLVGGTAAGAGNVIAFNGGAGVLVGSDAGGGFSGDAGVNNAVEGNSIFANVGLGIDLGAFGTVTANDANDADTGPNNLQNFPVLAQAFALESAGTLVTGSLNSVAGQQYRIEFFADPAPTGPDGSGHGEGRLFLGAITVNTGAGNTVSFSTVLTAVLAPGTAVTATATDAAGNTSEFALNIIVV